MSAYVELYVHSKWIELSYPSLFLFCIASCRLLGVFEFKVQLPTNMADEQIRKLIKHRGNIKRLLTCSETLLSSIDQHTDFETLNLEDRFGKHLTLWDAFDNIQSELEDNLIDEPETTSQEKERKKFENRFHKIRGLLKKYIKNPCSISSATSSRSNLSDNNIPSINESLQDRTHPHQINRLPQLHWRERD